MGPWRHLALFATFLGLILSLVAQSTNFWMETKGPHFSAHAGIWPKDNWGHMEDSFHVTQSFSILAALCSLGSTILLAATFVPTLTLPFHRFLFSACLSFAGALFMTVAMAVYTSKQWYLPLQPQIQYFFSWSFYLGWVSAVTLLCAGVLSMAAHFCAHRTGYENL